MRAIPNDLELSRVLSMGVNISRQNLSSPSHRHERKLYTCYYDGRSQLDPEQYKYNTIQTGIVKLRSVHTAALTKCSLSAGPDSSVFSL